MKVTVGAPGFQTAVMVSLLLCLAASASPKDTPPLAEWDPSLKPAEMDSLIPALLEDGTVPGISIAVIEDGEIAWSGAYGVACEETGEPVTDSTVFEAASLTKPLFAYLVLLLEAEGVIDLDEPIVSCLPAETMEELLTHDLDHPDFRRDWFEMITPRQILSHTSGMPHGEPYTPCFPLLFEPGTDYKYSATGYYFLQAAVENLTGSSIEEMAETRIFRPLGMDRSSLVWTDAYEGSAAQGHGFMGGPESLRKYTEPHAAASLYTTASDYARFLCAVLNSEQLSVDETREMLQPQVEINENIAWSMGFGIQRDSNGSALWQWGDYGIFRNYALAYMQPKCGVVFLTNSWYGLGIGRELVSCTVGGEALGLDWLSYADHTDPFMRFCSMAIENGAEYAISRIPVYREEQSDLLGEAQINALGYSFMEVGRMADALAFFLLNAGEHPESSNVWDSLGEWYMTDGQPAEALQCYRKALLLDGTNENARVRIDWLQLEADAAENPPSLDDEDLIRCTGVYGPRRVTMMDGVLYYCREGSDQPERMLIPLTPVVFALEGSTDWRFRFEFDQTGSASAIEGMSIYGPVDRHERTE